MSFLVALLPMMWSKEAQAQRDGQDKYWVYPPFVGSPGEKPLVLMTIGWRAAKASGGGYTAIRYSLPLINNL